jgi:hypothetical protein
VGSVSGLRIGEGPGKYGGAGVIGLEAGVGGGGTAADRSDDTVEGERPDSDRGTSRAVILEEIGDMSEGELTVESSSSSRGDPGNTMIPGGSGIGSVGSLVG